MSFLLHAMMVLASSTLLAPALTYAASPKQIIVLHTGRLFDSKSAQMISGVVFVMKGGQIVRWVEGPL